MPAVKIFDALRDRIMKSKGLLPAEERAMFWFKTYSKELTTWQRRMEDKQLGFTRLQKGDFTKQIVGSVQPGFFYFYAYDPKYKRELPYYDKFPFTLVLDVQDDRYMGLNFHYLDYYNRAKLFDALYPFREGRPSRPNVRDIRMRLKVSYEILQASTKYRAYKPCLKTYLKTHVRSPFIKVGAKEWDVALFLPVEQFEKQTKTFVWSESAKKI